MKAFVFPGQGSQKVGMGVELAAASPAAREVFQEVDDALGQSLFNPPNVAGWAGGRTWITPSTLLQRGNLLRDVLYPNVNGFRPPDRAMSGTDARVGQRLAQGMDITEATKESEDEGRMAG